MKISRRAFAGLLLAGGATAAGLRLRGLRHGPRADGVIERPTPPDGLHGYPIREVGGRVRPAWTAAPGERIQFALSSQAPGMQHLRLLSARGKVVHDFGEVKVATQSLAKDAPWLNGAGFQATLDWEIPADLHSGAYFINGLPELFVIVRSLSNADFDGAAPSTLPTAVLIPTNTINAYSTTLGRSSYNQPTRVPVVSFLRPMDASVGQQWIGTLKWLEAEPLYANARYLSDHDLEDPSALEGVKFLVVAGHSEYWSRQARIAFDSFVHDGGHALLASGNAMYWQIRFEQEGERMVAYKSFDPKYGKDPITDPLLMTGLWHSRELEMPTLASIGGDFRHGGFGSRRHRSGVSAPGLRVADGTHPLLTAQRLANCAVLDFHGVLEYDGAPIAGLDASGLPVADLSLMNAHRLEIIAYEWSRRGGTTMGTAHVYQREARGGVVLHLGAPEATNRAKAAGCAVMRAAALEFTRRLASGAPVFSDQPPRQVVHALHTPWKGALPALDERCGPSATAVAMAKREA